MSKKYSPRTMPIITRESYNVERAPALPNWMDEFAKNIQKVSVEPIRHENSIYDQISSIMGNKSKYPTVEAAVEDMKERSGLSAYLKNVKSDNKSGDHKKKADCGHEHNKINLFEKMPQIKTTVDNYLEDSHGNLPIPAIVERIKSIHKNDVSDDADWDDVSFLKYLNQKNIEVKSKYPSNESNYSNLGKVPLYDDEDIDPSNTDALHALTPAVVSK